jgi:hypothetical protein
MSIYVTAQKPTSVIAVFLLLYLNDEDIPMGKDWSFLSGFLSLTLRHSFFRSSTWRHHSIPEDEFLPLALLPALELDLSFQESRSNVCSG